MVWMTGLTLTSLKKHKPLIPLFFFLGLGAAGAGLYLARLGLRSPDVTWKNKSKNDWQTSLPATYQHKFFSPSSDYKDLKKNRPDF